MEGFYKTNQHLLFFMPLPSSCLCTYYRTPYCCLVTLVYQQPDGSLSWLSHVVVFFTGRALCLCKRVVSIAAAAEFSLIVQARLRPPTNSSVAVKVYCSHHHNVSVMLDASAKLQILAQEDNAGHKKGLLFDSLNALPHQKTSFEQIAWLSLQESYIRQSPALSPHIDVTVRSVNSFCLYCLSEHKVIIVGLDNAGKTTILYQL